MSTSEKEKMLSGLTYNAMDPLLLQERRECRMKLIEFNKLICPFSENDSTIYKQSLIRLLPNAHSSAFIEPSFKCDYGDNIYIAEDFYANFDCVFLDVCKITIGKHVKFGPGVHIYTATHPLNAEERRSVESGLPVIIEDDCWLGGRVTVMPGVTIGARSVIAAGAVVTKDVPCDSLVIGVPGVVKRKIDQTSF